MDNNNIEYPNEPRRGKAIAGVILLVIGCALLLRQLDFFFFPSWLISWPVGFIIWGFYSGTKHNFRNSSSFIFIALGVIFLLVDHFNVSGAFIWPIGLIAFGIWIILKRSHHTDVDQWEKRWGHHWDWRQHTGTTPNPNDPVVDYTTTGQTTPADQAVPNTPPTSDDFLEAVSIFGGVKKTIFSKNFQGGEIVNVFGGAEIDLTQADIKGRIYIDVTQVFGGVKIIVPSHWMVISDMAAIFAGFDDKRIRTAAPFDNTKVLVLKGTSIFGGTDVRSY